MKNLTVTQRASRLFKSSEYQLLNNSNDSKILCAVNSISDEFYLLLKNKLFKIPSDPEEDIVPFDVPGNLKLVDLEYCSITQELYAACVSGDIMRMTTVGPEFECDVVTELDINLQCMKLSPDHEIIVVITENGTVITMVSTFHVIGEVDLYAPEFGQKQFVTVGWGKKETQFHGSEGKRAAVARSAEIFRNESDDEKCRITWREDGSLFAVGFLHPESRVRWFKVFSREGILQYTSELISGLEEQLSWKPSGSLIAATQSAANKHVVVLFEKNGLKHRTFALPFKPHEIRVKDLFWSPDSEILTIWCQTGEEYSSVLQLWTENNYHWYLKQTIDFPVDNPLIFATWSTVSFSKRLIVLTKQELATYEYNWCVDHSRGSSILDKSVVGVIDGSNLLMTALRKGSVPPPMAHHTLETSEPVNAIAFAPNAESRDAWLDSNALFCVSASNRLIFFKHVIDSFALGYEQIGSYDIKWNSSVEFGNSTYNMHHFLWLDENTVLCSLSMSSHSFLCILTLTAIDDEARGQVTVQQMHVMDGLIQHIVASPESKEAYIVVGNSVVRYTREAELIPTDIRLQDYAYKAEVVRIGAKNAMLSLSHRNSFSINGKHISSNVTSFCVHSEFLLLTTLQHTLICVGLNEEEFEVLVKQDLTVKPWENLSSERSVTDLNLRRVERGSQLIAVIPKDSKVILQMPRGNLECIQPRALSLYIIDFYLSNCDYLLAFDFMRRQRINLNLIYDYDPKKFVENADKFVEQVFKPSWLSLLLSELVDEDVTTTMYGNYYRRDPARSETVAMNKVELVCQLLRSIMEETVNRNDLIQPILISLVKDKRKQGLEAALTKIKEIRELEKSAENVSCVTSDEALKYLLYIVDVNALFDTALGMYDFDLTMFIASNSHKDPKEYVPFLNGLTKLDENYMKYTIDVHLKRYESALEHVAKESSRFDECMNLIRSHDLYAKALKLFEKDSEEYKEVARFYGEFLLKKRMYQEAGIMFRKGDSLREALNAYKLASSWQEVIIVITEMKLSVAESQVLYKEFVERLKSDKKYGQAAHILMNYLQDFEEAVICMCNGKYWMNAVRCAHKSNCLDLIESRVKPSVHEYADHLMSQIQKNRQEFEQYRSRLAAVRVNISQRCAKSCDGIADNESICNRGISDILSDTSSVSGSTTSQKSKFSSLSGKSYRSSKNRRKHERKLLSLKQGSAFEDLALIQALHQIVSNTYKEKGDLYALVQMLIYFNDDEYAEQLQNCMEQFMLLIKSSKSEIWDKFAPSSLTEMENAELSLSTESQGLSASKQFIELYVAQPPVCNSLPWKLNLF